MKMHLKLTLYPVLAIAEILRPNQIVLKHSFVSIIVIP